MGANTETLQGRQPVRLPAWIVIGVALALTAAIAVVTMSGSETTVNPAREPAVVGTVAGSPDSVAEMAALKAALATGDTFRFGHVAGSPDSVAEMAALKAAFATGEAFGFGDQTTQRPRLGHRGTAREYSADPANPIDPSAEIAWLKAHLYGRHQP